MLYFLQQGPTEQKVLETAHRMRAPIPKTIAEAPSIDFGMGLYWTAYMDLLSCREAGLQEGRITWLTVDEYGNRIGLSDEQKDDLQYYVREMDEVYLKFHREKRDNKATPPPKKP